MPNWCSNQILFTGSEENQKKVIKLFIDLQEKENKENCGQKPEFSNLDDYFFNIYIDGETIDFETRWSPKIELCIEIAKHFELNFECTYIESGNQIFGKTIYTEKNEQAEELDLDNFDYNLFSYDDDNDSYNYKGENYESDFEILEKIWEEKFNSTY